MKAEHVVVIGEIDEAFSLAAADSPGVGATLAREGISLVFCSSMTRAEIDVIQQTLAIREPFICESGAAVLVPHQYFPFEVACDRKLAGYHAIEFGRPHAQVLTVLRRTAARLSVPVIGFSDLTVEEAAAECGLPLAQARLAKLREYDEPFRLLDPSEAASERLWKGLRAAQLTCTHRGRVFEHVGAPLRLRSSIHALMALYRRRPDAAIVTRVPLWERTVDRGAWVDAVVDAARRAAGPRATSPRSVSAG